MQNLRLRASAILSCEIFHQGSPFSGYAIECGSQINFLQHTAGQGATKDIVGNYWKQV